MALPASSPQSTVPRSRTPRRLRWPRALPPVRLLWLALLVLGIYGSYDLRGLGAYSLLALPAIAVTVDLGFQRVRFPKVRFPDAALATGLFLALLFPPVASLVLTGLVTFAAIVLRHALRIEGHPWMNPAALGVAVGTVLLGLQPAWWVAVGTDGFPLMLGLGALLLVRNWRSWRLPVSFLVSYGLFVLAEHLLIGAAFSPQVLLLELVDPVTLFFGLFMVTEPRTAPGDAIGQTLFGIGVGLFAVALPLAAPSIGVILALLLVNLTVVAHRTAKALAHRPPTPASPKKARKRKAPSAAAPIRWPVGYRAASLALVAVVFLAVVAAAPPPAAHPLLSGGVGSSGGNGGTGGGGGGGGTPVTSCTTDNPSIPSSTLQSLHSALGPSVILSYDANTGVVVFYDPVNHVTVTETDLYEDFGYAEFNGDDYAVSGCHP